MEDETSGERGKKAGTRRNLSENDLRGKLFSCFSFQSKKVFISFNKHKKVK